jgi:hypothetical protein
VTPQRRKTPSPRHEMIAATPNRTHNAPPQSHQSRGRNPSACTETSCRSTHSSAAPPPRRTAIETIPTVRNHPLSESRVQPTLAIGSDSAPRDGCVRTDANESAIWLLVTPKWFRDDVNAQINPEHVVERVDTSKEERNAPPKALTPCAWRVTISATRRCWSERKGRCDSQEIRKSRPAGESPVRSELSQQVGSEPCSVSGNAEVDA